jgi:hypothetical protein
MVPFLYSDHRLLLSASTFADCCHFLNVAIEDTMYLSLYDIMTHSLFDTWHHNKISKACQANNMTHDSKSVNLTHFQRLLICNLFLTKHISFTWQPQKSL